VCKTVSVLSASTVTTAWQIMFWQEMGILLISYCCEGFISRDKMVDFVCCCWCHITCLHTCHIIADFRKLKLHCLSNIQWHNVCMKFHENWSAASEDNMVIQHCRVLTMVMFQISFFSCHKKEAGKKINLVSSVSVTHITLIHVWLK
jgi:hypothetical protein